jgi:hypothetical protein
LIDLQNQLSSYVVETYEAADEALSKYTEKL